MSYLAGDWAAEVSALYLIRTGPPACPQCNRRGFYGPRHDGNNRMYRLCKFCGFSQTVGCDAVTLRSTVHDCFDWLSIAGAKYIWWVQPTEEHYTCPHCGNDVRVDDHLVSRPVDDLSHPWWDISQSLSHDEALVYWTSQHRPGLHL